MLFKTMSKRSVLYYIYTYTHMYTKRVLVVGIDDRVREKNEKT